ncbi:hypothetical protein TNCV_2093881 [Trichonephila clavipes]|nr:hypothetical protein TNCV_2093881 [Trichonephila clavipes]
MSDIECNDLIPVTLNCQIMSVELTKVSMTICKDAAWTIELIQQQWYFFNNLEISNNSFVPVLFHFCGLGPGRWTNVPVLVNCFLRTDTAFVNTPISLQQEACDWFSVL